MLSFYLPATQRFIKEMQKSLTVQLSILLFAFSLLAFAIETKAQSSFTLSFGPMFTVNSTADSLDANVGDGICADSNGQCTLRAAIEESNFEPAATISSINLIIFALPDPAVIDLTLGELNITAGAWIFGPGARRLTVQRSSAPGTPNFRIFRVASSGVGVEIARMSIRNGNVGSQNGGGILVEDTGALTLRDINVRENSAANGGGIANAGRHFIANRVLLNSNSATAKGGGIFNQVTFSFISGPGITNSTLTNNSAASGAAIYSSGSIYLANDTIFQNTATEGASSVFNESGSINVVNCIIGNNAPSAIASLSGAFISKGNNLVTDSRSGTGFTNGVNNDQVSENNAIDPMLGPLADNGGHTDTRALLTGSPAINAGGDCVLTDTCLGSSLPRFALSSDQRGRYQRKVGNAVDIGAFEAGGGPPLEFVSFGLTPRPETPAFFSGAVAMLTSATTNEKTFGAVNPFGWFRFQNLPADFYILQIRGKRAFFNGGVMPIGLDEIPGGLPTESFNTADILSGFRLTIEQQKTKLGSKH